MDRPNEQAGDAAGETMTLTRAEIESVRNEWQKQWRGREDSDAYKSRMELCDLALSALSQEAVRDEVLEALQNYAESFSADDEGLHLAPETWNRMRELIRALKREPNAEAQASGSSEHTMVSATPAPATPAGEAYARDLLRKLRRWLLEINHGYPEVKAYPMNKETELGLFLEEVAAYLERPAPAAPDVASMVKRLGEAEDCVWMWKAMDEAAAIPIVEALRQAAALLAKLGQGWIPVHEEDSKGGLFLTGIPGKPIYALDERGGPQLWYRFDLPPLPPVPGASDD